MKPKDGQAGLQWGESPGLKGSVCTPAPIPSSASPGLFHDVNLSPPPLIFCFWWCKLGFWPLGLERVLSYRTFDLYLCCIWDSVISPQLNCIRTGSGLFLLSFCLLCPFHLVQRLEYMLHERLSASCLNTLFCDWLLSASLLDFKLSKNQDFVCFACLELPAWCTRFGIF